MNEITEIKVRNFISHTLIDEIKDIQDKDHHYLSFGLIAQGIEFLGACIDEYDLRIPNKSKERFTLAIKELFPLEYQDFNVENNSFNLYKNLRCGVLHVLLPYPCLELIQEKEIPKYGNHLEIKNIRDRNRLILVSQYLFEDFKNAAKEVIRRIDNHEITHEKVYNTFLYT